MIAAALDIGSNSVHLLIARQTGEGLVALERLKNKVQLGAGLDADNNLSLQAIERGLDCLRDYIRYLNDHKVQHLFSCATNAMRLANNSAEFITQAEGILMHPVEVISGNEEARLIFKAIASEKSCQGTGLVIDVGGGSTEIALGKCEDETNKPLTWSIQMGCVSYSRQFFTDGKIFQENTKAALTAGRLYIEPVKNELMTNQCDWMVGTSGTFQSISELCHDLYGTPTNVMVKDSLEDLLKRLVLIGHVDKLSSIAMEDNRKPILPAGLCICLSLMQQLEVDELEIGQSTLCEGMLIEGLNQTFVNLDC